MASRLPTHLGSLIPPPAEQVQQRRPWQGTLSVTFINAVQGTFQDIYVTAAETDGESRMDLWPRRFCVHPSAHRAPHNDIEAWVKRYTPPICALMPDSLPDPAANAVNQANFANLSRMLLDKQLIAMAPWGLGNLPGANVMIYLTSSSASLIVGAISLSGPIPEFAMYQRSDRPNPPNLVLGQASTSQHQYPYGDHHGTGHYPVP